MPRIVHWWMIKAPALFALVLLGAGQFGLSNAFAQTPSDTTPQLPARKPAAAAAPENRGLQWSSDDMDHSPVGNVEFHGPFGNENLTVACENMDNHDFLDISFDLLILRSWDGSVPVDARRARPVDLGPDFFRCGIADGPTLLYTTFSNIPHGYVGFHVESKSQMYPSQIPGDHNAPQAGAAAVNSMGYNYPWLGPPQLFPMDATYHIHFVIPHQQYEAIVQFSGMNLQPVTDESWGVTHFSVKPLSAAQVTKPGTAEISRAFTDAGNVQAANQIDAFQTLILGMDDTTEWIDKNVAPAQVDGPKVTSLIRDLFGDDTQMSRREAAGPALFEIGPQVEAPLRDARRNAVGEQRQRIDWVLCCIGVRPIEDDANRRVMLATRVLEIIGTPKAMQLRKRLTER